MRIVFLSLLLWASALACNAQETREWTEIEKQFINYSKQAAKQVNGMYSNRAQADTARSKFYASQDLRSYIIWEDRWMGKLPEVWYYFGWFATDIPDNPLAEFIACTRPISKDSLSVDWYRIPNASKYKREWERTYPFKDIDPDELLQRPPACRCYLNRESAKESRLRSIVPCPITGTTSSKFKYMFFDVLLMPDRNVVSNKYYDQNFNTVYEFKEPAQFKLLTRNRLKFTEEEEGSGE